MTPAPLQHTPTRPSSPAHEARAARVLHLIAAPPRTDHEQTSTLDAVLIAIRAATPDGLDPLVVAIGPWRGARAIGRSRGISITHAMEAPGRTPELAWPSIRRWFASRRATLPNAVHCWGLPAATIAPFALPRTPRLFTPLEPVPGDALNARAAVARRALRGSVGVFFDRAEAERWRPVVEGDVFPTPAASPTSPEERDRARAALGLDRELLVMSIGDVETGARRAALTHAAGILHVAEIRATVLARHGPHARRARTLGSRPAFRIRELPTTVTPRDAIAAADIGLAPVELRGLEVVGSAGLHRILVRSACRSGLPCIVPDGAADADTLPAELAHIRTPDASAMGMLQRVETGLLTEDQRRGARSLLREWVVPAADTDAFADSIVATYHAMVRS